MKFTCRVQVDVDAAKILKSRGLGASHEAEMFLAGVVRQLCDPYVPMDQGMLKNTSLVISEAGEVYILYNQPYAHYQYIGEVYGPNIPIYDKATGELTGFYSPPVKAPTGRELTYSGAPMRGKMWDKRMMADRGDEVRDSVAKFIRGELK